MRDNPLICWNCDRQYDRFCFKYGGISGDCHACGAAHWVIVKEDLKKVYGETLPDFTPVLEKDVKKYLKALEKLK